ncbi:MAG: large-conductance mechanosensitive channel protein MscL [Acidobacteriaceae bacterium]|nr:large-conductance mechanosensitive channel protein MscL [Acidobacteriaceae bacterium]
MLKEFKAFIMRGNVLDLAIAVLIGAAFGAIVTSMVNDILMPPLGLITGHVDFTNLFINLTPDKYSGNVLADAKKAGAATINYGVFINNVINFLIVAFCIFLVVKAANKMKKPAEAAAATAKECPFCLKEIPLKATKCAFCTSALPAR